MSYDGGSTTLIEEMIKLKNTLLGTNVTSSEKKLSLDERALGLLDADILQKELNDKLDKLDKEGHKSGSNEDDRVQQLIKEAIAVLKPTTCNSARGVHMDVAQIEKQSVAKTCQLSSKRSENNLFLTAPPISCSSRPSEHVTKLVVAKPTGGSAAIPSNNAINPGVVPESGKWYPLPPVPQPSALPIFTIPPPQIHAGFAPFKTFSPTFPSIHNIPFASNTVGFREGEAAILGSSTPGCSNISLANSTKIEIMMNVVAPYHQVSSQEAIAILNQFRAFMNAWSTTNLEVMELTVQEFQKENLGLEWTINPIRIETDGSPIYVALFNFRGTKIKGVGVDAKSAFHEAVALSSEEAKRFGSVTPVNPFVRDGNNIVVKANIESFPKKALGRDGLNNQIQSQNISGLPTSQGTSVRQSSAADATGSNLVPMGNPNPWKMFLAEFSDRNCPRFIQTSPNGRVSSQNGSNSSNPSVKRKFKRGGKKWINGLNNQTQGPHGRNIICLPTSRGGRARQNSLRTATGANLVPMVNPNPWKKLLMEFSDGNMSEVVQTSLNVGISSQNHNISLYPIVKGKGKRGRKRLNDGLNNLIQEQGTELLTSLETPAPLSKRNVTGSNLVTGEHPWKTLLREISGRNFPEVHPSSNGNIASEKSNVSSDLVNKGDVTRVVKTTKAKVVEGATHVAKADGIHDLENGCSGFPQESSKISFWSKPTTKEDTVVALQAIALQQLDVSMSSSANPLTESDKSCKSIPRQNCGYSPSPVSPLEICTVPVLESGLNTGRVHSPNKIADTSSSVGSTPNCITKLMDLKEATTSSNEHQSLQNASVPFPAPLQITDQPSGNLGCTADKMPVLPDATLCCEKRNVRNGTSAEVEQEKNQQSDLEQVKFPLSTAPAEHNPVDPGSLPVSSDDFPLIQGQNGDDGVDPDCLSGNLTNTASEISFHKTDQEKPVFETTGAEGPFPLHPEITDQSSGNVASTRSRIPDLPDALSVSLNSRKRTSAKLPQVGPKANHQLLALPNASSLPCEKNLALAKADHEKHNAERFRVVSPKAAPMQLKSPIGPDLLPVSDGHHRSFQGQKDEHDYSGININSGDPASENSLPRNRRKRIETKRPFPVQSQISNKLSGGNAVSIHNRTSDEIKLVSKRQSQKVISKSSEKRQSRFKHAESLPMVTPAPFKSIKDPNMLLRSSDDRELYQGKNNDYECFTGNLRKSSFLPNTPSISFERRKLSSRALGKSKKEKRPQSLFKLTEVLPAAPVRLQSLRKFPATKHKVMTSVVQKYAQQSKKCQNKTRQVKPLSKTRGVFPIHSTDQSIGNINWASEQTPVLPNTTFEGRSVHSRTSGKVEQKTKRQSFFEHSHFSSTIAPPQINSLTGPNLLRVSDVDHGLFQGQNNDPTIFNEEEDSVFNIETSASVANFNNPSAFQGHSSQSMFHYQRNDSLRSRERGQTKVREDDRKVPYVRGPFPVSADVVTAPVGAGRSQCGPFETDEQSLSFPKAGYATTDYECNSLSNSFLSEYKQFAFQGSAGETEYHIGVADAARSVLPHLEDSVFNVSNEGDLAHRMRPCLTLVSLPENSAGFMSNVQETQFSYIQSLFPVETGSSLDIAVNDRVSIYDLMSNEAANEEPSCNPPMPKCHNLLTNEAPVYPDYSKGHTKLSKRTVRDYSDGSASRYPSDRRSDCHDSHAKKRRKSHKSGLRSKPLLDSSRIRTHQRTDHNPKLAMQDSPDDVPNFTVSAPGHSAKRKRSSDRDDHYNSRRKRHRHSGSNTVSKHAENGLCLFQSKIEESWNPVKRRDEWEKVVREIVEDVVRFHPGIFSIKYRHDPDTERRITTIQIETQCFRGTGNDRSESVAKAVDEIMAEKPKSMLKDRRSSNYRSS